MRSNPSHMWYGSHVRLLRVRGHHPRRRHVPVLHVVRPPVLRRAVSDAAAPAAVSDIRLIRAGLADAGDVVDRTPPLVLLVHGVEPNEVLLRVARHLRGRAAHHEVARDGAPVALAELGEPEEKQTVLLFGPGDALASLLVGGLRGGRLGAFLGVSVRVSGVHSAVRGRGAGRTRRDGADGADGAGERHGLLVVLVVRQRDSAALDVLDILLQQVEPSLQADHVLAGDGRGVERHERVLAVHVAQLRQRVLEELLLLGAPVIVVDQRVETADEG
mmetsp:Transcript_1101/g.4643  ORF Transcript_1101/g.4643 Transcript_1101/m.4643 type:complete len:274 (+) Transcript_1101:618-1439(+)